VAEERNHCCPRLRRQWMLDRGEAYWQGVNIALCIRAFIKETLRKNNSRGSTLLSVTG